MKRAAHLVLISILSCATSIAIAADAAADYPNRPIRFIAPFVAGGPSDILSRLLGQKLTESWGQPVIVDNRGSAGGIVGFEIASQALPDGYTLLLATSAGLTINPSVYKKLPYDPVRDFQPITQVTSGPYLMVIHPSVAAKSVPEFIALAKAKPGQLNFSTTGTNISSRWNSSTIWQASRQWPSATKEPDKRYKPSSPGKYSRSSSTLSWDRPRSRRESCGQSR